MDRVEKRYLRELCLASFYHFVSIIIMHAIRDDEQHPRLPLKPFHEEVLDFCQDSRHKRKGILMPRYFLKSTTITCSMPLWLWLRNNNIKSLIVTETTDKATDSIVFIRGQIEKNTLLRLIFPEVVMTDKWKRENRWSAAAIDFPNTGVSKDPSIRALGVGVASQGIHVDHAFLDDIIGQKDMLSAIEAQNTWTWFGNVEELTITPDRTKPHASYIYLIGTHYAPEDIYDRVRKTKHEYRWKHVPAEENGEPTWPEKLSKEAIEEMKNDPDRAIVFYTQMQNNPMESGLTAFKPEWKKFYQFSKNEDGDVVVVWIDQEDTPRVAKLKELDKSATIDPATISASMKSACRTAIVVVGTHHKTNTKFVLEAWAKRIRKPAELYNKIFEFHEKYRPRKWGIETFSQQNWAKSTIMTAAQEKKYAIYLRDLPKDMGKDAKARRIEALQEDFACGQIYFHETQRDLIGEYHGYPMAPTNDLIDALGYHKYWWRSSTNVDDIEKSRLRRESEWQFETGITGYGDAGY